MAAALAAVAGGCGGGASNEVARPFAPEAKRTIEAELHAARAARQELRWKEAVAHAGRAGRLALVYGQVRIAEQIAWSLRPGCGVAGFEFHMGRALHLLRRAPTAPG